MTPSELKEHTSHYRVLYVEDEPDLRAITTKLFKQFFTEVDTATNGKEGLDFFKQKSYDLIISDINMPVLNGVEMVQQMKEIKPDQAVIITSAQSDPADFIALIDAGVDKFVLKPLDLKKLIDAFISFVIHKQHKKGSDNTDVQSLKDKIQSLESMLKLYNLNYQSKVWEEEATLVDTEVALHQNIFDIQMGSGISDEDLSTLTGEFSTYQKIVAKDSNFKALSDALTTLIDDLGKHRSLFSTEMSKVTDLLEEITLKLQTWREYKGDEGKAQLAVKNIQQTLSFLAS